MCVCVCVCGVGECYFSRDDNSFLDINECASKPCLNEATCLDHLNSYTCACVKGYRGKKCQTGMYGHIGHSNIIIYIYGME